MRFIARALPLLALLAAAPAAGAQAVTLHEGMTEAEVVGTLGPPAVVRRVEHWSYLFYPVRGRADDVLFFRDCRLVAAVLRTPAYTFAGPPPATALTWTIASPCAPALAYGAAPGVTPPTPDGAPPADTVPAGPLAAADPAREDAADAEPTTDSSAPSASAPTPAPGTGSTASPLPVRRDSVVSRRAAARNRGLLRLSPLALRDVVRPGPAGSVSVPTAFGVETGEFFVGAAYQGRTRYTDEDDAALVFGIGVGSRRVVALEAAVTSFSTIRGDGPGADGGLSLKLHRALPHQTGIAVGWENGVQWGQTDADETLYAVATRIVHLRADPTTPFSTAVATLGLGTGRFRPEDAVADGRETVGVFGAVGVRVTEPVSAVADWTGQDLNVALSITPIRRVPLVVTPGVADITGTAGDGARFILSVGYGMGFRLPF